MVALLMDNGEEIIRPGNFSVGAGVVISVVHERFRFCIFYIAYLYTVYLNHESTCQYLRARSWQGASTNVLVPPTFETL